VSGQPASGVRYEAKHILHTKQCPLHCNILGITQYEVATITNISKENITTSSRGDNTAQASFFHTSNVYHFGML